MPPASRWRGIIIFYRGSLYLPSGSGLGNQTEGSEGEYIILFELSTHTHNEGEYLG